MRLTTEVRCFRCNTAVVVNHRSRARRFYEDRDRLGVIADELARKGWDCTSGTVACRAHKHLTMMPPARKVRS